MNQARERGELLLAPDGWPGAGKSPTMTRIVPLLELATVTTGDRESGRRCPARWCSRWHSRVDACPPRVDHLEDSLH